LVNIIILRFKFVMDKTSEELTQSIKLFRLWMREGEIKRKHNLEYLNLMILN